MGLPPRLIDMNALFVLPRTVIKVRYGAFMFDEEALYRSALNQMLRMPLVLPSWVVLEPTVIVTGYAVLQLPSAFAEPTHDGAWMVMKLVFRVVTDGRTVLVNVPFVRLVLLRERGGVEKREGEGEGSPHTCRCMHAKHKCMQWEGQRVSHATLHTYRGCKARISHRVV